MLLLTQLPLPSSMESKKILFFFLSDINRNSLLSGHVEGNPERAGHRDEVLEPRREEQLTYPPPK